jgi:hypothetical protein
VRPLTERPVDCGTISGSEVVSPLLYDRQTNFSATPLGVESQSHLDTSGLDVLRAPHPLCLTVEMNVEDDVRRGIPR